MLDSISGQFDSRDSKTRNLRKTLSGLTVWSAIGLLGIASFAVSKTSITHWYISDLDTALGILGYGILAAIACAAIGGLFGFLFGIPRTVQQSEKATVYKQEVNTNLEQISDWLTKILVGVGLTQLNQIRPMIWSMAERLKPGLDNNQALAVCIMLNFGICGFFTGYLLTRLFLAGAFVDADQATILIQKAQQVAQQFSSAGQYKKATQTLEIALAAIDDNTPKDKKRDTYERLTYNYLYQDPPDGFMKAIELGKEYTANDSNLSSPRVWTNLASAYGQQYAWEVDHEKRKPVLSESRNRALDAVRRALALEPRMLSMLRLLWDPNDPTKVSAEENDLEVFYDDEEFRKVLAL
jgi:tetratricopeptide (TPR) repeat protein